MQTDAVEQQEQIAALRDFAATGLAELELRLAEGDRGQAEALENFAAGLDLAELERLLAGEKQAQIAALERFRRGQRRAGSLLKKLMAVAIAIYGYPSLTLFEVLGESVHGGNPSIPTF